MLVVTRFDGSKIKEARLELGLSRSALSIESGIPEQNLGRWERGEHMPQVATLNLLAVELGKPLEFFYTDDEEAEAEEIARKALAS